LRSGVTFVDFSLVLAMLVVPFGLLLWPVHVVFRIRAVVSTWVFLECGEAHLKELRTRWIFATVTGAIGFSIGMIALVAWMLGIRYFLGNWWCWRHIYPVLLPLASIVAMVDVVLGTVAAYKLSSDSIKMRFCFRICNALIIFALACLVLMFCLGHLRQSGAI